MRNQPPNRKPTSQTRYVSKREVPNMATPQRLEPSQRGGFLGILFILGMIGVVVWMVMLVFRLGPYQVESNLPVTITGTNIANEVLLATSTSISDLVAEDSPTATGNPPTLAPTLTETVTSTPTPEIFPFVLDGAPEPVASDLIRPQLGCDYLIIAGQVWDLHGDPVTNSARLHLYGELGGFEIDEYSNPGSALVYGQSGYEFILKGLVVNSERTLTLQLEDTEGNPLSSPYTIQTYQDCQKNLILVNFKKVR
jgi:hypothetical protein